MAQLALSALAFGLTICVHAAPPTGVVDKSVGNGASYGLFYHNEPFIMNGNTAASNTDFEDYTAILFPKDYTYRDYEKTDGQAQDDKITIHDGYRPEYGDKYSDYSQGLKGNQRNYNTHLENISKRNDINPNARNYGIIVRPSIKSQVLDRKVDTQGVNNNNKEHNDPVSDTKAGQIDLKEREDVQNPISHEHPHKNPSYEHITQDKTRNNDNMKPTTKGTDDTVIVQYQYLPVRAVDERKDNNGKDEKNNDKSREYNKFINNAAHTRTSTLGHGYQKNIENIYTDFVPVYGNINTNANGESHSPKNTILDNEKESHSQNNNVSTVTSQNSKKGIGLWSVPPSLDYKDEEDNKYDVEGNSSAESNESSYNYAMDVEQEAQKQYAEKNNNFTEEDKITNQKDMVNDNSKYDIRTGQKDMVTTNSEDDIRTDQKYKSSPYGTNVSQRPYLKVIGINKNQSDDFINNVDDVEKYKLEDRKVTFKPRPFWEVVASTDSNSDQFPGNGKKCENNNKKYEDKNNSISNGFEDKGNSRPYWEVIGVKNHTETKVTGYGHKRGYTKHHHRKYSNRRGHKRHHHSDNNNKNKDGKNDGIIAKTKDFLKKGIKKFKNLLSISKEAENDSKHEPWHGKSNGKFKGRHDKGDNSKGGASNHHKYKKYCRYSNNRNNKGNDHNNGNINCHWMHKYYNRDYKGYRGNNRQSQYYNNGGNIPHWQDKDGKSESRDNDGRDWRREDSKSDSSYNNKRQYNDKDGDNRDWKHKSDKGDQNCGDGKHCEWRRVHDKSHTGYNNKRQYNEKDGDRRDYKHRGDDKGYHYYQNNHRNYDNHDWNKQKYHGNERRDGNHQYNNNDDDDGRHDRMEYHNNDGHYKRNDYQTDNRRYGR